MSSTGVQWHTDDPQLAHPLTTLPIEMKNLVYFSSQKSTGLVTDAVAWKQ